MKLLTKIFLIVAVLGIVYFVSLAFTIGLQDEAKPINLDVENIPAGITKIPNATIPKIEYSQEELGGEFEETYQFVNPSILERPLTTIPFPEYNIRADPSRVFKER